MIKKRPVLALSMVLVMFLALCVSVPSALAAADATSVDVNGVTLDASTPYLANGSGVASATQPPSGGYAHFDAATATLTLNNAVVDTPGVVSFIGTLGLIAADGNVTIVLEGSSSLSAGVDSSTAIYGIVTRGSMTIGGSGSVDINVVNANSGNGAFGLACATEGVLTVNSGTLSVTVDAAYFSMGLSTTDDIVVNGGTLTIEAEGDFCYGINARNSDVYLNGGTIQARCVGNGNMSTTASVRGAKVHLNGADGTFFASSSASASGMQISTNTLTYTDGEYLFVGGDSALEYQSGNSVTYALNGATVMVSTSTDGSSESQWTSDADGLLVSTLSATSPFRYVRFFATPAPTPAPTPTPAPAPTSAPDIPRTGDTAQPWLWMGLAGICMLLGSGLMLRRRKRA